MNSPGRNGAPVVLLLGGLAGMAGVYLERKVFEQGLRMQGEEQVWVTIFRDDQIGAEFPVSQMQSDVELVLEIVVDPIKAILEEIIGGVVFIIQITGQTVGADELEIW